MAGRRNHPRFDVTNAEGTLRPLRDETETWIRLLDWSPAGCQLESDTPLGEGTIAMVRVGFGGQEFDESVEVVRCQAIEGGGNVYRIGAYFVAHTMPFAGSLRHVMFREVNKFAGSLLVSPTAAPSAEELPRRRTADVANSNMCRDWLRKRSSMSLQSHTWDDEPPNRALNALGARRISQPAR